MHTDEYTVAIARLQNAIKLHLEVYNAQQTGLAAWHESCQKTFDEVETARAHVVLIQMRKGT